MKKGLFIQFPDGTIIEEQSQFDSYVTALKRIGLDRAAHVASDMRFTRKGAALISKTQSESIINSGSFTYVNVDGYNVVKGISPDTMVTLLRHISESLDLGISANYSSGKSKQITSERMPLKIVSWNANGKFREKYQEILKLEADIYVIQECENPETCKDASYRAFFTNYHWAGVYSYKGLMVFSTRPDIRLVKLNWGADDKRVFIPVRVNNMFNLVAAWACDPYCEELQDWIEVVAENLSEETIIIGDLNSNVTLDPKHIRKSGKSFGKCINLLADIGLVDIWHHYRKEEQGKEKTPTFYLYRHLDKPLHIDHCFASPNLVYDMEILARYQCDHLPLIINTK